MKVLKMNSAQVVRWYKAGKNVNEIAQKIGYESGHGNNRVRNLLIKKGLYKKSGK